MKTIKQSGVTYPLLKANKKGEVKCPFCGGKHKHGKAGGNGHRVPDCDKLLIRNPIFTEGAWLKKENGYFVEF